MRKVVAATFLSLDGVMQAPGGPEEDPSGSFRHGGWVAPHFDEAIGAFVDTYFAEPFDLLLGRRTYEIFAAHWPYAGADDPIGKLFSGITKYVATRKGAPLDWQGSVALEGDGAEAVRRLKAEDGPVLLLQGSSELIQSLLAADLIDEIHLLVFPVLLGRGKRLFGAGTIPAGLKHVTSSTSPSGVLLASYRREGEVGTGSFEFEQPTEAELARRERWKREG